MEDHCNHIFCWYHSMFSYDPITGILTRKSTGKAFGQHKGSQGYAQAYICPSGGKQKSERAHRIIWQMHYRRPIAKFLDHINGVRDDNRIENLRECTPAQNAFSIHNNPRANGLGRGVSLTEGRTLYRATYNLKNKRRFIGFFKTPDEAAHAHNKAVVRHYGDFAVLNPVGVCPREAALTAALAQQQGKGN